MDSVVWLVSSVGTLLLGDKLKNYVAKDKIAWLAFVVAILLNVAYTQATGKPLADALPKGAEAGATAITLHELLKHLPSLIGVLKPKA